VALAAAAGCDRGPTFGQVEGVVTLDGKPLPEAGVAFLPDGQQGNKGPISRAVTDSEGRYRLTRGQGQEGAVVGWHRVVVDDHRAKAQHLPASRVPPRYESLQDNPLPPYEVGTGTQSIDLNLRSN
jgi:hypothetical protein